jgi:hypothetical protein
MFPSPINPEEPVSYERVRCWLTKAEELAKVAKQQGGSFHPYRRAWATARKHLPLKDVAAAGGWKSEAVLLRHYQQPDEATLLRVVTGGLELREQQAWEKLAQKLAHLAFWRFSWGREVVIL